MDAYQQPHRFMRPQPPSMADPHFNPHHAPPPRQPVPPQGPWYSGQFQYQAPSPPPPPQWHPQQPQSDHLPPPLPPPYPATLHNSLPPYTAHLPPNQLPPHPYAHLPPPPPPPPHSQIPQPYSQVNQDWGNSNWGHLQSWEYPAHKNEEDWATRARAWAAAKSAMDNQHSQSSQFTPIGRQDEHGQYSDQYPQAVEPHYPDLQQQPFPSSSYQQYPVGSEPPHRPAVSYLQEPASISSGSSSYGPDGRLSYTMAGDPSSGFPHQDTLPASSSVHPQEVPSSYSSIAAAKDATADQNEQLYKSVPFPVSADQQGQHHAQSSLPPLGRSVWMEQPHFAYGSQSAGPTINLADQPLDFAPRFNHDHDPHLQPGYAHPASVDTVRGTDPVTSLPPVNNWTPSVVPGSTYPSAGPQHDPTMILPPPISGHSASLIGRITGQSLQPPVPSIGATFGLGPGSALHPTTGFSSDAYGISAVPERPKKASVPNWLKEEIIKKKSVITSSAPEHLKEETPAFEDDAVDKSVVKGHQADSVSLDSSRSVEEEDDDEDYDEAARTAAINQEIKRVLTEVLLKVTDELFDEIATKVINESDMTDEVTAASMSTDAQNHNVSPSASAIKASAKVLIPVKASEPDVEDMNGNDSNPSAGNILGLANYASDDDNDDEIRSFRLQNSTENSVHQQSDVKKFLDNNAVENSKSENEDRDRTHANGEIDLLKAGSLGTNSNGGAKVDELSDNRVGEPESCNNHIDPTYSFKAVSEVGKHKISADGRKDLDDSISSKSKYVVVENVAMEPVLQKEDVDAEETMVDGSQGKEVKIRPDKNETHEIACFARNDIVKQFEAGKMHEKGDEKRWRQDDRHVRREKAGEQNGSKQRFEGLGFKHDETAKESDSRKRSLHLDNKDRKETERVKKSGDKEEGYRKRERVKDEKGDRSRHKPVNESSRHKRRRSSSPSNMGGNSRENRTVSHAHDTSDDASDDSKRKLHSRRQNLSPLPSRSKRRQVSRSPHSKRSQRRHSPYSSLEAARGRRSRSKSPARRRK